MAIFRVICILVVIATGLSYSSAQTEAPSTGESSTYGKEFCIGFMQNIAASLLTELQVIVGTTAPADSPAQFVVESADGTEFQRGTVSSGSPVVVDIPFILNFQVIDHTHSNRRKGVKISSTNDQPIFVLGTNRISFLNYASFLAYPSEPDLDLMGSMYEYSIMSIDHPTLSSQFLLVGCSADTQVMIIPTQNVLLPSDAQDPASDETAVAKGTKHNITLNELDTLLVKSPGLDLTGTRIISNKPLTVISGHECAQVPQTAFDCEPLAVQIPPVKTWGTKFMIAGFAGRTSEQLNFRIVPSEENTTLDATCGQSTLRLFRTTFQYAVSADQPYCFFEFNKPVFLAQVASGRSTDDLGDPAISIISPVDQYINTIEFVLLPTSEFPTSYISITVPVEHYDVNSILLDGVAVNCIWTAIYNSSNVIVGYGCNVTMPAESNTSPSQHTLSHSDPSGRLSATVYGFRAFPSQGYAYLAGQELKITEVSDDDGDDDELPTSIDFIDVTLFPNAQELPRVEDASSERIILPFEILFGDQTVTVAFVNENGVISFNEPWKFSHPERFPTRNFNIRARGIALAPFWSDIDIRRSGHVRYTTSTFPTTNRAELFEQFKINRYVGSVLLDGDLTFRGSWFLIAHWDRVHQSPHGADDHLGIPEEELDKTNSFQAIIVSNITNTYVVFNYICGELQWSGFGRNKALVGYIADGATYINHPASGTSSIAEIISCSAQINKKRRKRQGDMVVSQFLAELPADPVQQQLGRACVGHRERNRLVLLQFGIDEDTVKGVANTLDPCPPSVDQAEQIVGRFVQHTDDPVCYISGGPIRQPGLPFSFTQQCCYDDVSGDLVTDRLEGFAGTVLLFHPTIDTDNHDLFDKMYRETCCDENLLIDTLCKEYFDVRPINQGDAVAAPAVGVGLGRDDPLYHTLDDKVYLFMGVGDFVTLDALDDANNVVFSLQSRLDVLRAGASWSKALAFGEPGLITFQVDVTGNGVTVTQVAPSEEEVNQANLDFETPSYYPDLDLPQVFIKKIIYERNIEGLLFYFFTSKIAVRLRSEHRPYGDYINWNILVPREYERHTQGLLGFLDGDTSNDFRRRDGSLFPQPHFRIPDNSEAFNIIVQEWSVRDDESLFKDANNAGRKRRQVDEDNSQNFPDGFEFTDEQINTCEGDLGCLYHLVVIDDQLVADNVLIGEHINNATLDTLANTAPNISASGVFRVNLQEESIYTFQVVDPGDTFTLSIQGGQPPDSSIVDIGGGVYEFRWNLQSVTNTPLVIVATDTRNVSSTHTPRVEVCGCVNDGVCTLEGVITTNTTITMTCLCSEAFSGQFCEEDRNGCSELECFEGVECLDIPAPGTGAVCGACPLGFTGDGLKCYDLDECATNLAKCSQTCSNTDGSFFCGCQEGYRLQGDTECEDVDECAENLDECQQNCANTVGSYECSCDIGFNLNPDGRNCTVIQPCDNNGGCSHICAVVDGVAQCYCPIGLMLSGGTECIDINECLDSACDQECMNTVGSFECVCREGYNLLNDGRTCQDIDECTEAALNVIDLCEDDQNTECENTEGSFACVCVPGFSRENGFCQRIVEEPPPPPVPVVPPQGEENSVSFLSPTLTLSDFTPVRQQSFRNITSSAVNSYCQEKNCTIILLAGDSKTEERPKGAVQAQPLNVAIPSGLLNEDQNGQLNITFYIQLSDGFLSEEDLRAAVQESEDNYRNGGFLQQAPFAPTNVQGFCNVVVWSLIVQPGGEIFAYDIRFIIPDTNQEVIISLGKTEFYVLEDDKRLTPETSVLVQVRGINAIGVGEWSSAVTLGCVDPPTIQPITCPEPATCPPCPTCATCPTCETCPTQPPCPTCETPPPCPTCETCPTCPTQPPCPTCPTCETCPTTPECPTCETCPSSTPCPVCPTQPPCPTCETPPPCPTCETCPTQPPCPTCETCPTQPACPTCSTETCPPCVCETEPPLPAIHFELGGRVLLNNSVINLEDVGQDSLALMCVTDRFACCRNPNRAGNFYFPSNVAVPNMAAGLGFWRGRGEQSVRLSRRETTTSPLGVFRCEIPDANGVLQNVYITLQ